MEKCVCSAGDGNTGRGIGKRPLFGQPVKFNVKRSDALLEGDGDLGITGGRGVGGTLSVVNTLGLRETFDRENCSGMVCLRTVCGGDKERSQKQNGEKEADCFLHRVPPSVCNGSVKRLDCPERG